MLCVYGFFILDFEIFVDITNTPMSVTTASDRHFKK